MGRKCIYCGETEDLDLLEVWGREFMLQTCCEGLHEEALRTLEDGSRDRGIRDLFEAYGIPCRAILGGQDLPTLQVDHGLAVCPVSFQEAKAFIEEHHAHSKAPVGWRWGHGLANGPDLVGVCTVGRPVARMIDGNTTVEVNRLCIRRDLPAGITWNGCSMLYAEAAREARRRGYARIITYTLECESGTSLRAAGWTRETMTKGGAWTRRARPRGEPINAGRKWRYSRSLRRDGGPQQQALLP